MLEEKKPDYHGEKCFYFNVLIIINPQCWPIDFKKIKEGFFKLY